MKCNDRMVRDEVVRSIEAHIGRKFEVDCCCNNDGSNAIVTNSYFSENNSFLTSKVHDKLLWINPPYENAGAFIAHYKSLKRRWPNTSACIMVPKWEKASWWPLLEDMQLIKEYHKYSLLFTAPTNKEGRKSMPGTPWPVQVYYDPPKGTARLHQTGSKLTFTYDVKVAKQPATLMLDTGASHNFVSKAFADRHRMPIASSTIKNGIVADNKSVPLDGHCRFHVSIGKLKWQVTALVLPDITSSTDVILGDQWLQKHSAWLHYDDRKCSILYNGKRVELYSHNTSAHDHSQALPTPQEVMNYAMNVKYLTSCKFNSAKQVFRHIRKGGNAIAALIIQETPNSQLNLVT